MFVIRKTKSFYYFTFILFSLLRGGTEVTQTSFQLYVAGNTSDLVATYFNENATGLTLVFTPTDNYDNLKVFIDTPTVVL